MKIWSFGVAAALLLLVANASAETEYTDATVAQLIEDLGNDKSNPARRRAAKALAAMGKSIVPRLIEAAQDANYNRRIGAMWALRDIGPDAVEAIPVLVTRLNEDGGGLRMKFAAAAALGAMGEAAADTAPELLKHIDRDRTFFGPQIHPALAKLGPRAAKHVGVELDKALPNDSERRRRRVSTLVGLLVGYGEDHALPLFEHKHADVRALVCTLMAGNAKARAHVLSALDDEDGKVRMQAASSLRGFDGGPMEAKDKLIAQLSDEYVHARVTACWAIREIGPNAADSRAALLRAANGDPQLRLPAALALEAVGHKMDAIAQYIHALQVESHVDRYSAAMRLGDIGPAAASAVPALMNALDDESTNVRRYSAEALGKIGSPARKAIPKLEAMLSDDVNYRLRKELTEAIKRLKSG